jgi:predicted N-formylglutamate amidohydrolase
VASAFPQVSEATVIPGNAELSAAERLWRQESLFDPYHDTIARLLAEQAGQRPVYVAMHSFTPVYLGTARPMHVAVLYNRNPTLSQALAALLRQEEGLVVAENEPYQVSDETDYGVPVHAEGGGLDYLEIEIRQDLIDGEAGQADWARRLGRLLPQLLGGLI